MNSFAELLKLSKNFQMLFKKYSNSIFKSIENWNKKLRIKGVPVRVEANDVISAFHLLSMNNSNLNYLLRNWKINRLAQNVRRYSEKAKKSILGYDSALIYTISVLIALRIIKLEYKARSLDPSANVESLEF